MLGLATAFGTFKGRDPAQASSPTPKQAVTATAENFAAQAIHDFRTAPASEKSSASGLHNIEAFILQYSAKDLVSKGPAKYVIEASVTKDSSGNLNPRDLNSIIIRESADGANPYFLELGRTDNNTQWVVDVDTTSSTSPHPADYTYTTGAGDPQEGQFHITTAEFGPIAQEGQVILTAARNHTPITRPAPLPFPPPVYVPH